MSRLILPSATLCLPHGGTALGVLVMGSDEQARRDLIDRATIGGFRVISLSHSVIFVSEDRLFACAPESESPVGEATRAVRVRLGVLAMPGMRVTEEVTTLSGQSLATLGLDPADPTLADRMRARLLR